MRVLPMIALLLMTLACSPDEKAEEVSQRTVAPQKSVETPRSKKVESGPANKEQLLLGHREVVVGDKGLTTIDSVYSAVGISTGLVNARKYFANMDFQNIPADCQMLSENRQELMAKSVRGFFEDIDDLVFDDLNVDTPAIPKEVSYFGGRYKSWESLSVLAVGMSAISKVQYDRAKECGVTAYSMLDLIQTGLLLAERSKGSTLLAEQVLQNLPIAEYLLQLRHNFFPFMLAAKLSSYEESFLTRFKMSYFDWSVNLDLFHRAQLEVFSALMTQSIETRNFLLSQKIPLKINNTVQSLFSNLRWETHQIRNFETLIEQLGMNPNNINEHKRFFKTLGVRPKVNTVQEKLVVDVNQVTGASLFVFNRQSAAKSKSMTGVALPTEGEGSRMSDTLAP